MATATIGERNPFGSVEFMKIRIGDDEIDLMTKDDLSGIEAKITNGISALRGVIDSPTVTQAGESLIADASGLIGGGSVQGSVKLFHVQQGAEANIERISVSSPQYTPASPLSTGWLIFAVSGRTEMFLPNSGTQIAPTLYEATIGIRLKQNDSFTVWGGGFAAGTTLNVSITAVQRHRNVS